ncbi:protein DBF4 homolog B isoform X2 [Vulpes vulpes]|uniref:Protein DBF4 homolog B isoform X2 n=2 Tax=Vulpes vulpes TaxID=9627 RepID=A0ABM4ZKN9_VULVU
MGVEGAESWRRRWDRSLEAGAGGDGRLSELQSSMAEGSLRAPDLGTQLGVSASLKKCRKTSTDAGRQPFSGKSFYLDLPAGKSLQFLTGAIQQLGGVIEGFLSKEVSYIVSSRREAKAESNGTSPRGCPSPSEVRGQTPSIVHPQDGHTRPSQKPADSVPMSRGKELLQKAIRNQESSSRGGGGSSSSLLTNARSWGVRILHVDEMLMHVQQLSLNALCVKKQGLEKKPEGTCPAEPRTRKARLKAPFLKIEDESRKFRPFHHQFKSFPEISFLGPKDASPFEALMTPSILHHTREPKDREPSPRSATRTLPRRRKGFCECCQEAFEELHAHLRSTQHQGFASEAHPYAEVDRLIAQLSHSFADVPFQTSLPRQPGSPSSDGDPLWPETLPPSQPSHPCKAASPSMKEEDKHQASGAGEPDGTVDSMKSPTEPMETGKMLGPATSYQELEGSIDVIADPPGTPVSQSPVHECLLTSSGSAEFSGLDVALVGHKRKVQFPKGNPEKRSGVSQPQASFFVPRASSPGGTRTTSGRPLLSLPLPGHERRPLTSFLPLCPPQTCLSPPDSFPWQPPDRPAECWAAQPPWPGGGWPPRSEESERAAPGPSAAGSRPAVSPSALGS